MAAVLSYVVSQFIGVVPLVGSMLAFMLLFFAIFALVGGVWLVVAERRAASA